MCKVRMLEFEGMSGSSRRCRSVGMRAKLLMPGSKDGSSCSTLCWRGRSFPASTNVRDDSSGLCWPRVLRSDRGRGPRECRVLRAGQACPSSAIASLSSAAAALLRHDPFQSSMS